MIFLLSKNDHRSMEKFVRYAEKSVERTMLDLVQISDVVGIYFDTQLPFHSMNTLGFHTHYCISRQFKNHPHAHSFQMTVIDDTMLYGVEVLHANLPKEYNHLLGDINERKICKRRSTIEGSIESGSG